MSLDWDSLDRELADLLGAYRAALAALDEGRPAEPWWSWRLEPEGFAEVSELDDPTARAFLAWLEVLLDERFVWRARQALAGAWNRPTKVAHLKAPIGLRALRRRLLASPHPGERARDAEAFGRVAREASDLGVDLVERRLEQSRGRRFGEVEGLDDGAVVGLAEGWLARTDDAAAEMLHRERWWESLALALGRGADEGWPAHLTARWLSHVFGEAFPDAVRFAPAAGPPWGATSFARALADLGGWALSRARPADLPLPLHQHPFGLRRHRRRALFAGLVVEPAFAGRVLGLGSGRARKHQQGTATAILASLRIDAARVLLAAALREGRATARERLSDLGPRLFGATVPDALIAVLPELRPAHAAAFAGSLLATADRAELVARFDEDWFQNPEALASLAAADAQPMPVDDEERRAALGQALGEASAALAELLESPFG